MSLLQPLNRDISFKRITIVTVILSDPVMFSTGFLFDKVDVAAGKGEENFKESKYLFTPRK